MLVDRNKVSQFALIDCGNKKFVGVFDPVQLEFIAGELVILDNRFQVETIGSPLENKAEVIEVISQKAIVHLTQ